MFTLGISCLTTSNSPWFMDLTYQVAICNIALYSIGLYFHHQTHPLSSCSHFDTTASSLLELLVIALCSSAVAYWTLSKLESSSSDIISFLPFMLSMGFSRQEYCRSLPFPSPVDYVLSELFTMTWLSWVTMHGMAHSFIESCKPSSQKRIQLFTAVLCVCVCQFIF